MSELDLRASKRRVPDNHDFFCQMNNTRKHRNQFCLIGKNEASEWLSFALAKDVETGCDKRDNTTTTPTRDDNTYKIGQTEGFVSETGSWKTLYPTKHHGLSHLITLVCWKQKKTIGHNKKDRSPREKIGLVVWSISRLQLLYDDWIRLDKESLRSHQKEQGLRKDQIKSTTKE